MSSRSASQRKNKIRIAVTSFLTEDASWSRAAVGVPDHSRERYSRLVRLSNAIIRSRTKPDYVLFPELAIPRRWGRTLAQTFLKEGISLIMGVEYEALNGLPANTVANEAHLYLTDNRLGYPHYTMQIQRKGVPAHHELSELRKKHGLAFPPIDPAFCDKRVYRHFGFDFSLLLCSELSNIDHRAALRGKVDNLFVLSWNQDLESFSSLTEASAMDVHCFVTLVNNRRFGDSRVRAPFKEHWRRDVVRVKGGLDDYFVTAELDLRTLREFQSHNEPPQGPFKPTPEGFMQSRTRYIIPGS